MNTVVFLVVGIVQSVFCFQLVYLHGSLSCHVPCVPLSFGHLMMQYCFVSRATKCKDLVVFFKQCPT